MRKTCLLMLRIVTVALVLSGPITSARAQSVIQSITLQPGWNAVYLEVQPADNTANAVFGALPVAGVWTRAERQSSVDFIQNPSEEAFNNPAWLGWFAPSRPEAFLGNLFAVFANRAYLVKSTNGTPFVWNITGRPSLRSPAWVPDSYNLRGAPVSPAAPPTFLNFFRHSAAHYDATAGQLRKIYRLNSATSQWQLVAAGETIQSGAAYWIYCEGASDYLAPLDAQVDLGDGLDFGTELTELNLRLANRTPAPLAALVRDLAAPNSILSYHAFDPQLGGQWPALPNPLPKALAAGEEGRWRLAPRRQDQTVRFHQSVLEVTDGAGTRLLVPVQVENPAFPVTGGRREVSAAGGGASPLAGLWVGSATLNAVAEAHSANPTNPTPVKAPLNLRLIVHVDANGQARLLKEVLQMWRNGTHTNDGSGNLVVDKPGQYVLLTDDSLIPQFDGAALRDGEAVGRRVSTIGYDFPSSPTNNFLNLTGAFAIGQSLTATLTLPHDHPTNPFKHKYHPDHDNLTPRFDGPAVEAFTTTRAIRLDFAATPPDGPAVPDFGYSEMGGAYRETITGVHKHALHVRGTFRLTRLSLIAQLNPSPTP